MTTGASRERTIPALLERQATKYGERTFLYFKDKTYSYDAVDRMANRVAGGLQEWGIQKGDKVAMMMENGPEFLFSWFGLAKLGAVEVPINTAHKGDLLTHMLTISDARMLIMDSRFEGQIEAILENTPDLEQIIVLTPPGEAIPAFQVPCTGWDGIIDNDGRYDPEEVLWSDPSAIVFTSGTTGPSKGPVLPHNHPITIGELAIRVVELTENDRIYNALPLFHVIAQNCATIGAMMCGASMVLEERFTSRGFWEDIRRYDCTVATYVGGILSMLLKADPKPDDAENPLRAMLGVGCPMDLFRTFESRFGLTLI
jgi:crotonobetaine/carnitine-CoA ligase